MKSILKYLSLASAGLSVVFLTGCASIISGRQQQVTFTSNPDDAVVAIDGKQIGKTPITAQLDRKGTTQVVTIQKDGYKPTTFQLKSTVNPWFFGNLIFGGLCGSSTDSSTGAINAYSQDMFNVSLNPAGVSSTLPPATEVQSFIIVNYKNIIEELNGKPDQYLKALLILLKVPAGQEADITGKIKNLATDNKDIVTFANKVSDLSAK